MSTLKHITFTGVDAMSDIKALQEILREFPLAEFGVLTSYHWNEIDTTRVLYSML